MTPAVSTVHPDRPDRHRRILWPWVAWIMVTAVLSGCVASPETRTSERQTVIWQPPETWYTAPTDATRRLVRKDKTSVRLSAQQVRHLWEAKTRIEQQADYPVELAIVDSKAINVFAFRHEDRAMIGFTRAFVKQFGDNADIIGVTMGHEIAHHTLGHTRGSRGDREAAMQIAASVLGTIANQFVPFSGNAVGLAVTSVGRSFSRNEERDADATGFTLAHRAGFDICEGATLWQQLHDGNADDLLQTLVSTHPGGEERLENLQALAVALRGRGC